MDLPNRIWCRIFKRTILRPGIAYAITDLPYGQGFAAGGLCELWNGLEVLQQLLFYY